MLSVQSKEKPNLQAIRVEWHRARVHPLEGMYIWLALT